MNAPGDNGTSGAGAVPDGIIIVGGGWAGLAAAIELARHGRKPVILEAARTLGGRARTLKVGSHVVNNGQHVLLGAYRSVLTTLSTLGLTETDVFKRTPLGLTLKSVLGADIELQTRLLPAPLHLLWALIRARGVGIGARRAASRLLLRARRDQFDAHPDVTLVYYLRQCKQPAEITRALWQPLCQATLATPIELASTRLFLRVLRDVFFSRRTHSDLLIPTVALNDCLPRPAAEFIEAHGGSVRVGSRVNEIVLDNDNAVAGIRLKDQSLPTRHVILATAPDAAATLLRQHAATTELAQQLEQIELYPVCTLFLEYPTPISLPQTVVGVLDGTVQWMLDRGRVNGTRGLITAVIGGPGPHTRLSNEALTAAMIKDVARLYPDWPAPISTHLVREKHATVAATPEVDALRPKTFTPIKGLWLAGDYTVAGYPGNLETAVRSGILAARRVLRADQRLMSP